MRDAVIVDAVRTPVGKRNGALSGVHPAGLSALVLTALAQRNALDPVLVDDVVWGCVAQAGEPTPFGPALDLRLGGVAPNQGVGAETIAERWGLSRTQLDEFSLASHEKAAAAQDSGRFDGQIVPVTLDDGTVVTADEGVRRGSTGEGLAKLKTA